MSIELTALKSNIFCEFKMSSCVGSSILPKIEKEEKIRVKSNCCNLEFKLRTFQRVNILMSSRTRFNLYNNCLVSSREFGQQSRSLFIVVFYMFYGMQTA